MTSYSGSPGYTFATSGTTLDPLTDRLPPRAGSLMGGDAFSQSVIEDMLMGRGDQYSPDGLDAGPMFPESDPVQDYIGQQFAGDVVPLRPLWSGNAQQVLDRFEKNPLGTQYGMRGMQSLGYERTKPLDLMNIYNILTGREIGR